MIGDSLCRETEGPIHQLDPFHRWVCCLLGTWVRDVIRRLPGLVEPSDYYLLLVVVQVGSDKVDARSLMAIKKNFRALGQQIEGAGVQVVFSSIPLVAGRNAERSRRNHLMNMWLKGHQSSLGFCDNGAVYMAPGLLETNGACLSKSPWVGRDDWEGLKLGLKEEGGKTRLDRDEPGCRLPVLGVKSVVQLKCIYSTLTLKCVSHIGTCSLTEMSQGLLRYYKPKGKSLENYLQRIKGCVPLGTWHSWQPSWGCLCIKAHSTSNKQEELETTLLLESYDLVAITEMWDKSHDWTVTINGYRLFRRHSRKRGGGIAPYVKRWIECEEMSLKNGHEQVESLWVKIRHQGNKRRQVVGDYCRFPDQGEPIDKALLLQL